MQMTNIQEIGPKVPAEIQEARDLKKLISTDKTLNDELSKEILQKTKGLSERFTE
ncbi:hypothetical protein HII12_003734 [Brettanomyces bruxellensis]|uniref:Uncharacterized protein n=1 Tax=Dekkera bruxellensis TaxID=5007 RepID=A0A8H6ESX1_DEKBR|nr:hypothetical protein HII12_003734 [Brettanomyces bruxellensis]